MARRGLTLKTAGWLGLVGVAGNVLGIVVLRPLPSAVISGIATVPVCLQIWSDLAARWLAVAGPLWLLSVAVTSVLLIRDRL
jgi:hypothetical protein